jgi:hypothetical protein
LEYYRSVWTLVVFRVLAVGVVGNGKKEEEKKRRKKKVKKKKEREKMERK